MNLITELTLSCILTRGMFSSQHNFTVKINITETYSCHFDVAIWKIFAIFSYVILIYTTVLNFKLSFTVILLNNMHILITSNSFIYL